MKGMARRHRAGEVKKRTCHAARMKGRGRQCSSRGRHVAGGRRGGAQRKPPPVRPVRLSLPCCVRWRTPNATRRAAQVQQVKSTARRCMPQGSKVGVQQERVWRAAEGVGRYVGVGIGTGRS